MNKQYPVKGRVRADMTALMLQAALLVDQAPRFGQIETKRGGTRPPTCPLARRYAAGRAVVRPEEKAGRAVTVENNGPWVNRL